MAETDVAPIYLSNGAVIDTSTIQIADSVTTTTVLEQILVIVIVAFVQTILELVSIIYIVFPGIKENISKMITSKKMDDQTTQSIKPLIETLALREEVYTKRANTYIEIVAWSFVAVLLLMCVILVFFINNEYRLRQTTPPPGVYKSIALWSFLTLLGIGLFQGFGCIILGMDSSFCSRDSFAVVSSEWKQNDNFAQIALSTGICDDVADNSKSSYPDLQTQIIAHLAQQFAGDIAGKSVQEKLTAQIQQALDNEAISVS